jgi:sorbitol-specific phosphotransferase system component IIA
MSGVLVAQSKLLSVAAVTSLLGGNAIFLSEAPERQAKPYIVIHKPAQGNPQLLQGDAGMPRSRVSFEIIANNALERERIGEALFNALKDVTRETVLIFNSGSPSEFYEASFIPTDFDHDDASNDRSAFRRIIDFYVDWQPA